MKTAVIYCRYSTENQDTSSLDTQERQCREYATKHRLQVLRVYADAAISGSHTNRPQLQKLLSDAGQRRFDTVLLDDQSRLSRDQTDTFVLVRQFTDLDIAVIDVQKNLDLTEEASSINVAVGGIVNSQYIATIRYKTQNELKSRALGGFATGGKAFGYTTAPGSDPKKRQTVIDPQEAELVRRIFTLAAEGQSPRGIAAQLNDLALAAPHDGGRGHKVQRGWGHTTIRSMLHNRRYLGDVTYNAHQWKKKAGGKRRRIARPDSEHVVRHYPELAIISQELWDQVQHAHPVTHKTSGHPVTIAPFALSGLIKCGQCGGSFGAVSRVIEAGKVYRSLGCVTNRSRGDAICPESHTVSEKRIMRALVAKLEVDLSTPDRVERFITAFKARFASANAAPDNLRTSLQNQITRQEALVANVLTALVNVPGSEALAKKLADEESTLRRLRADLAELGPISSDRVLPHPAAIAAFVGKLQDLITSNPVEAAKILKKVLTPFKITRQDNGKWALNGALDVGLCDKKSSGGVLHVISQSPMPVFLAV